MMHGNIVIVPTKISPIFLQAHASPKTQEHFPHVLKTTIARGSINVMQQLVTNELLFFIKKTI